MLTHIGFGPSYGGGSGSRVHYTCHVEVSEVYMTAGVQQHVGWLHVSMDDLVLPEVLQSKAEFCHVESNTSHGKPALLLQVIADVSTCVQCVCVCAVCVCSVCVCAVCVCVCVCVCSVCVQCVCVQCVCAVCVCSVCV